MRGTPPASCSRNPRSLRAAGVWWSRGHLGHLRISGILCHFPCRNRGCTSSAIERQPQYPVRGRLPTRGFRLDPEKPGFCSRRQTKVTPGVAHARCFGGFPGALKRCGRRSSGGGSYRHLRGASAVWRPPGLVPGHERRGLRLDLHSCIGGAHGWCKRRCFT